MECTWGQQDCQNIGDRCDLCITRDFHYKPAKQRSKGLQKRAAKADGRMGSNFEFKNHEAIRKNIVSDIGTRMTPNSGAGRIKGDQEITGIIQIMEELKTKVKQQAPGKKTFTIEKGWLDKLHREALAANKSFWYLKFSFHEDDAQIYCITEQDIIMSMVKTMVEDRKAVTAAKLAQVLAEKERRHTETLLFAAQAEVEKLKAQIALLEHQINNNVEAKQ